MESTVQLESPTSATLPRTTPRALLNDVTAPASVEMGDAPRETPGDFGKLMRGADPFAGANRPQRAKRKFRFYAVGETTICDLRAQ